MYSNTFLMLNRSFEGIPSVIGTWESLNLGFRSIITRNEVHGTNDKMDRQQEVLLQSLRLDLSATSQQSVAEPQERQELEQHSDSDDGETVRMEARSFRRVAYSLDWGSTAKTMEESGLPTES
jgi:hypothetical protein